MSAHLFKALQKGFECAAEDHHMNTCNVFQALQKGFDAAAEALAKYDPNQTRDEKGRFSRTDFKAHNEILGHTKALISKIEKLPKKPYGIESHLYNLYELYGKMQEHLVDHGELKEKPLDVQRHQEALARKSTKKAI